MPGNSTESACLPIGANGTYEYDGKAYEVRMWVVAAGHCAAA